jgi:hypothetical protein
MEEGYHKKSRAFTIFRRVWNPEKGAACRISLIGSALFEKAMIRHSRVGGNPECR